MERKKLGSLESLIVPGESGGPVIILCHGYGADALDLAPLARVIPAAPGTTWIFPDAPIEMSPIPGFRGRAWFPLVAEELARLLETGRRLSFADVTPPGLEEARTALLGLVQELDCPPESITLGGFSQGSMLATDIFLRDERTFAGLVILSGSLICRDEWTRLAPAKKGRQFFQAHGTDDPILPFANARALETVLRDGGLTGEFVSFPGGHEIPDGVVKKLGEYLKR